MALFFPPAPPIVVSSSIDGFVAVINAMSSDQKAQVIQLLLRSLPDLQNGDLVPDVGNLFVNSSGFLVVSQ